MKTLEAYLFKNVIVKDIYGDIHRGYVDVYSSAADNDDTEESIGLIKNKDAKQGIELYKSEIEYIEVTD